MEAQNSEQAQNAYMLYTIYRKETAELVDVIVATKMEDEHDALKTFLMRTKLNENSERIDKRDSRMIEARIQKRANPELTVTQEEYIAKRLHAETASQKMAYKAILGLANAHNDTGTYKSLFHDPAVKALALALIHLDKPFKPYMPPKKITYAGRRRHRNKRK